MHGETRSADGTTIRWLAAGGGPPFVLVPGGLGDEHAFDPLVARLVGRLCCITIGRRGKGYSEDGAEYSYGREYEDVVAVLDAAGPPRLLFGHSSGAVCALGAALMSEVEKLVIVEPPLPLEEPGISPEHDSAIRGAPNVVTKLAEAMPNAKVVGFTGHGHDVANTAAEDVALTIATFLEE